MDIYESITDLDPSQSMIQPSSSTSSISSGAQTTYNIHGNLTFSKHCLFPSELEISTPESNDSGIQSEHDILNRNGDSCKTFNKLGGPEREKIPTSVTDDSLYSSVLRTKTSSSQDFTQETATSQDDLQDDENPIVHLEQHELPLGWIRCCDELGVYYWHKPSGTVTRRPPAVPPPSLLKKNFDVNKFEPTNASKTSHDDNTANTSLLDKLTIIEPLVNKSDALATSKQGLVSSKSYSSAASTTSSTNSSSHQSIDEDSCLLDLVSSKRFFVRSLGWVRIDENDLTPERSSKAVNQCITDLSRGTKDLNDAVARWGEGKDMLMDIVDSYLLLKDSYDEKLLNKQSITSIRVWGVGRDNGRDFAYVARDKHSKIHMCHVFRCDNVPAKEIANALKDACRRVLKEKRGAELDKSKSANSEPKRKTVFTHSTDISNHHQNSFQDQISTSSSFEASCQFPTPIEEPRKNVKCRYLGSMIVNRPSGMVVLNGAIEKIYSEAFNDYCKQSKSSKYGPHDEDKSLPLKLGVEVEVGVSPSALVVRNLSTNKELFECRIRYLSFLGVSTDAR